jgi:hypothetical protein
LEELSRAAQLIREPSVKGDPHEAQIHLLAFAALLTRFVTAADVVAQRMAFEEMATRYPQDQAEAALRDLLSSRKSA